MSSPARACDRVTLRDSITLAHASLNRFNLSLSLSLCLCLEILRRARFVALSFGTGPGGRNEKRRESAIIGSRIVIALSSIAISSAHRLKKPRAGQGARVAAGRH
jgi:hypothetical protein